MFLKPTPIVRQTEVAECGLACLAMVVGHHGFVTDMTRLRHRFGVSLKGMTLLTLIDLAENMGLAGRPLRLDPAHLGDLVLPAILHWDMNHFVVLVAVRRKSVLIHDPARGAVRVTKDELDTRFTGIALELRPTAEFVPRNEKERPRLSSLWNRVTGLVPMLLQVAMLTLLLQVFVLAAPLYLQITVDEALLAGNVDLLTVLAMGFGLVVVFQLATTWLRGVVIVSLGAQLNFQIAMNVLSHLIRLPVGFFERRNIGDVLSRFDSIQAVRTFLSQQFVAATVDGVLAVLIFIVLFLYSPSLALVSLVGLCAIAGFRLALYRPERRLTEAMITARAEADSHLIETLRGIATIRLFGRETTRQQAWQERLSQLTAAEARRSNLGVAETAIEAAIEGLVGIVVVYVAARMTLEGGFTIGALLAFMSYERQMTQRARTLMDQVIDFRMLSLHLERLGDIVLSEREPMFLPGATETGLEAPLSLSLDTVEYSYGLGEPKVLDGVSLEVHPGETLAITGRSGGGKTTLMKIMLGLLPPSDGQVRVNGRPLAGTVLASYRAQVAAVLQDDQLFSGSLAENITFWDPQPDLEHIVHCAQLAAVHEDIAAMPMGYESLVGDMGSALSGGQKQRLLIARALYQRPSLLFLDESTSHLDLDREQEVQDNLRSLGLTMVIVAHRPATIASADRVVRFEKARLEPV